MVTAYCWHVNGNSQVASCVPEVLRDIRERGDVLNGFLLAPQHLCLPPLRPTPPTRETEHAKDPNAWHLGIRSPRLCQGTLCKKVIKSNIIVGFFTQEARVWAGAYDQVVSFASPDVLQGKDAPVPVLVARPDRLDLLAGLGQGEHLAAGLVRCQPQGVAVGGEGGGRAGVAGFRAGTKWNGEVESEVDCIAHLQAQLAARIGHRKKSKWGQN